MFHFSRKSIRVNEEQEQAICRPARCNQRILASAGSGKTTTLTARIAYLIEHHGVRPESIALMTFSRNAAQQMRQRIETLIGPTRLYCGTFHGLAKELMQRFCPEMLRALYFVDELIGMGEQWLTTREGRAWVGTLQYVVVDEFQDINEAQWRILQRMLHPGASLIIVGDDCQNIYTWRGSHVKYILELHKQIRGLVDNQLRRNYRSSEAIIRCANAVMTRIPSIDGKEPMLAEKKGGEKPHIHFFYRLCDETRWILETIQKLPPSLKIAVLSRTNSDLYRIEEEMIRKGIRCRLRDIGEETLSERDHHTIDLVTLHASKGLEWDCVFLVNCNDDVFPASKKADQIICERRLFYVGVTRARELLYISYTRDERALSRFVREIPSTLLTYHGLARYCLSDVEIVEGKKRLRDIIASLDGDALRQLREEGVLSWMIRENSVTYPLFRGGEVWKLPSWATGEQASDFQRFLRMWVLRCIASTASVPFRETDVEKMLFTLRVYTEDREFWQTWRQEIMDCLQEFFGSAEDAKDPPSIDYTMIAEWASRRSLPWESRELIRATSLIAKIRGQLRPLRFDSYSLDEFRLAPSRYVVPTEWRADVLRSWRRVANLTLHWKECLVDIWKLGAMSLVAEGRNAALYRATGMAEKLATPELSEYLECLEERIGDWTLRGNTLVALSEQVHYKDMFQETVDFHTEGTFWKVATRIETQDILELAMTAWFAETDIRCLGIFVPLEGKTYMIHLPNGWAEKAERVLARALL